MFYPVNSAFGNHHSLYHTSIFTCVLKAILSKSVGEQHCSEKLQYNFCSFFCSTQLFFVMILRPSIVLLVVVAMAAAAIAQEEAPEVIEIASTTLQPEEIFEITTVAAPEDGKM